MPEPVLSDTRIVKIVDERRRCHGQEPHGTANTDQIDRLAHQSSLYVWMLDNHDSFKEVIVKVVRPNGQALAEAFAEDGQTDAYGISQPRNAPGRRGGRFGGWSRP